MCVNCCFVSKTFLAGPCSTWFKPKFAKFTKKSRMIDVNFKSEGADMDSEAKALTPHDRVRIKFGCYSAAEVEWYENRVADDANIDDELVSRVVALLPWPFQ